MVLTPEGLRGSRKTVAARSEAEIYKELGLQYIEPELREGLDEVDRAEARVIPPLVAADVAGYSRLTGADEEGTHERLRSHLRELIEPKITEHRRLDWRYGERPR